MLRFLTSTNLGRYLTNVNIYTHMYVKHLGYGAMQCETL